MTSPPQVFDVGARLIKLLSQQRLLYRQLQELASKQTGLIDGDNPEMLLRVLADRQRLIDRLAAVDRDLEPIRADWKHISQSLPQSQRQEAHSLIAGIQEILDDIIVRDKKDTDTLSSHQQQVAEEIRTTTAGKRMNQAYVGSNAASQNRYFDTRIE